MGECMESCKAENQDFDCDVCVVMVKLCGIKQRDAADDVTMSSDSLDSSSSSEDMDASKSVMGDEDEDDLRKTCAEFDMGECMEDCKDEECRHCVLLVKLCGIQNRKENQNDAVAAAHMVPVHSQMSAHSGGLAQCACPLRYEPVCCGDNTYSTQCEADC